jgi:uncharacterized protein YvpB
VPTGDGWFCLQSKLGSYLTATGAGDNSGANVFASTTYATSKAQKFWFTATTYTLTRLDVPLHSQFSAGYPSGCEAAAVSMMVSYATGSSISVSSVVAITSYRGDPRGWFALCYPNDIAPAVRHFTGSSQIITGASTSTLQRYINNNKPVTVWLNYPGVGFHALCLTGYDNDGFYLNDPWFGVKDVRVSYAAFDKEFNALGRMAITY